MITRAFHWSPAPRLVGCARASVRIAASLLLAAALLSTQAASPAIATAEPPIVIDDFSTPNGGWWELAVYPPNCGLASTKQSVQTGAGILGGERFLRTEATAGPCDDGLGNRPYMTAWVGVDPHDPNGPPDGQFQLSHLVGVVGKAEVRWDGTNGTATTLNPTGLGNIDLTSAGKRNAFLFVGFLNWQQTIVKLTIYTDADNASEARINLPYGYSWTGPKRLVVPFSAFSTISGNGADFTRVGALRLVADGSNVGPYIDTIRTIDTFPPVLTLPGGITAEATSPSGAVVSYSVSAEDALEGAITPTCDRPSGSTFPVGTTTVTCSATDSEGNQAQGNFTVTVTAANHPPTADAGADQSAQEGATVTLDGRGSSDADGDTLTYAWAQTAGPTVTLAAATTARPTFVPPDNGAYTFRLTVSDGRGATSQDEVQVTVSNVAPQATLAAPAPVKEGDAFAISLKDASDPSSADTAAGFSYAFNCGDGQGYYPAGGSSSLACTARDDPSVTVRGKVIDKDGGATEYTATVNVANVAPTVGTVSGPTGPVRVNTATSFSATFTDPGAADEHAATWDWGDGSTSPGTVTGTTTQAVSGSHAYPKAGVYSVRLTVSDDDGGQGTAVSDYVVVVDPDGAWVLGQGRINSPVGACRLVQACEASGGEARFGFLAKYTPGATTPTGFTNYDFDFETGRLGFHADRVEWLVVGGARAQYKGRGTINNGGSYGFLLTAVDGQTTGGNGMDRFRIKIWDLGASPDGSSGIVYDNQMGDPDVATPTTALTAGWITIEQAR